MRVLQGNGMNQRVTIELADGSELVVYELREGGIKLSEISGKSLQIEPCSSNNIVIKTI